MSTELEAMIDIETLGLTTGNVILSIGCVKFDPNLVSDFSTLVADGFYFCCDRKAQLQDGFTVNPDTLDWWLSQSEEAKVFAFSPISRPVRDVLLSLRNYISDCSKIWSYGYLDPSMINGTANRLRIDSEIIPYKKHRDLRTIADFPDFKWPDRPEGFVGHHSLHDAAYQTVILNSITLNS